MTSILLQEYVAPERPYSQKELQCNRDRLFHSLRLGSTRACHSKCGHFYKVKVNGRKEKEIKEANSNDTGNCSVCWKFNKTSRQLKDSAHGLLTEYCRRFENMPVYWTFEDVDIENIFYRWLYEEVA